MLDGIVLVFAKKIELNTFFTNNYIITLPVSLQESLHKILSQNIKYYESYLLRICLWSRARNLMKNKEQFTIMLVDNYFWVWLKCKLRIYFLVFYLNIKTLLLRVILNKCTYKLILRGWLNFTNKLNSIISNTKRLNHYFIINLMISLLPFSTLCVENPEV
jgi:hypothetical protein